MTDSSKVSKLNLSCVFSLISLSMFQKWIYRSIKNSPSLFTCLRTYFPQWQTSRSAYKWKGDFSFRFWLSYEIYRPAVIAQLTERKLATCTHICSQTSCVGGSRALKGSIYTLWFYCSICSDTHHRLSTPFIHMPLQLTRAITYWWLFHNSYSN